MTQTPTILCAACGAAVPVTPASPYEFDWRCPCGMAGVIAWATVNPPPTFEQHEPQQQELFA